MKLDRAIDTGYVRPSNVDAEGLPGAYAEDRKMLALNIRLKGAHLILPKVERMLGAWGLTPLSPLFEHGRRVGLAGALADLEEERVRIQSVGQRGRECLLVRNSWGDSWADAGHAWLPGPVIAKHLIGHLTLHNTAGTST